MRMGLPRHVVLVEVPRPKAHCVEPVLLSMACKRAQPRCELLLSAGSLDLRHPTDSVPRSTESEQASGHGPESVGEDATRAPVATGR